jgi:hypothetical protein
MQYGMLIMRRGSSSSAAERKTVLYILSNKAKYTSEKTLMKKTRGPDIV